MIVIRVIDIAKHIHVSIAAIYRTYVDNIGIYICVINERGPRAYVQDLYMLHIMASSETVIDEFISRPHVIHYIYQEVLFTQRHYHSPYYYHITIFTTTPYIFIITHSTNIQSSITNQYKFICLLPGISFGKLLHGVAEPPRKPCQLFLMLSRGRKRRGHPRLHGDPYPHHQQPHHNADAAQSLLTAPTLAAYMRSVVADPIFLMYSFHPLWRLKNSVSFAWTSAGGTTFSNMLW